MNKNRFLYRMTAAAVSFALAASMSVCAGAWSDDPGESETTTAATTTTSATTTTEALGGDRWDIESTTTTTEPDAVLEDDIVAEEDDEDITPPEDVEEEIEEEIGQKVEEITFVRSYPYEKKEMLMLGFHAKVKKNALVLSKEVDDAEWVTFAEALSKIREGSIAWQLVKEVIESVAE